MTARFVNAHFLRHYIHVEKFAGDKQVLVGELLLPNDVRDVTDKHALISLKLLQTSILVNFTTEHVVLTRCLHKAVDALEHVHAVTFTNIVISWSFHVDMLSRRKVT